MITAEDITLIPDILANGERVKKQHGNTTLYEYKQTINGVKYTVLTEVNNRGAEIFDDYYTDRSKVARSSNTQLSAQADSNLASQREVTQNSANSNSISANQDISFRIVDTVERMEQQSEQTNVADWMAKKNAVSAINGKMNQLRRAMSAQRKYDLTTVKAITRLAKEMLTNGMLDGTSQYSVKRILGAIERAHGKQDVSIEVKTLMDVMIDTQLQQSQKALKGMLSIKGSKVNAKGVEVQGKLDADGVAVVKAFKNAIKMQKEDIEERLTEVENRMQNANEVVANDAIFTVTTEMSGMAEEFTNFFTNRKPTVEEQGSSNTENQHEQPQQSVSQREVTQNSANSNSEGEITRQGSGAVSDEGVTMASDPVSKAIGEPRYGRGKKMREYAERQRRFMVQKVQEIAQKLNLNNVEIVTDTSTLLVERSF